MSFTEQAEEYVETALDAAEDNVFGEIAPATLLSAAQVNATLAVAEQLGRIAVWLEGIELVDPDEAEVAPSVANDHGTAS